MLIRSFSVGIRNRYKYTSKERDSESGLDNFGARYYANTMGRFVTMDPNNIVLTTRSLEAGGLPHDAAAGFLAGYIGNPQNLSQYSYVRNNPLNLVDPNGVATDGHHLFSERDDYVGLARNFTEAIKTGKIVR